MYVTALLARVDQLPSGHPPASLAATSGETALQAFHAPILMRRHSHRAQRLAGGVVRNAAKPTDGRGGRVVKNIACATPPRVCLT